MQYHQGILWEGHGSNCLGSPHLKRQGRPEDKSCCPRARRRLVLILGHVHNSYIRAACWVTLIFEVTKLRLSNLPRGHMASV